MMWVVLYFGVGLLGVLLLDAPEDGDRRFKIGLFCLILVAWPLVTVGVLLFLFADLIFYIRKHLLEWWR